MKKLKLNLDEIKVESFDINQKFNDQKGTVYPQVSGRGCEYTHQYYFTCNWITCIIDLECWTGN